MSGKAHLPQHLRLDGGGHLGWIGAGVIVVGLHAGAVALALRTPAEDPDVEATGVVTLELSPIATSVREDVPDAPPGKPMQEAPNTPEQAEKKEDEKPDGVELDKAPLAPQPEVALQEAKPEPEKKEEKQPEQKAEEKSQASVGDPVTSAPQKIDAPVSQTTAAPVAGSERTVSVAEVLWGGAMKARIETHKRYPQQARSRGEQGTSKVQFSIDRKGNLLEASILESSGHPTLDEEAVAVLRRASPFPPPPSHMQGESIVLTLPLSFSIKRGQ
ncbi:MAG: energy transducer TonB [Hyphomicrobiaceae bacterium]|nr:energy transducer TonB [Hyphomicrobiaceae bacterium]